MDQKSYTSTPSTVPLLYKTYPELLEERFMVNPQKVATRFYTEELEVDTLTYAKLYQGSLEVSSSLRELFPDLMRGDKIGIVGFNTSDLFINIQAVFALGAVMVSISQDCNTGQELLAFLQTTHCKCLIFQHGIFDTSILEPLKNQGIILVSYGTGCEEDGVTWITPLKKRREKLSSFDISETQRIKDEILPDSAAVVFFTSGSTGIPKAVTYSHFQLINNAVTFGKQLKITENDIFFIERNIAHLMSFFTGHWFLVLGQCCVLLDTHFTKTDIKTIFEIVKRENCTISLAFGYILFDMLKVEQLTKQYLGSLRVILTSGQTRNQHTVSKFRRELPDVWLVDSYGTTEIGCGVMNREQLDEHEERFIGPPVPYCEMKIVGDHGETLPSRDIGEHYSRGPLMSLGYMRGDDVQKMTSPHGWYATGDMAVMNGMGHIKIVGRCVDIIKRAGNKIFPADVQNIICEHPEISACQVLGVPDQRLGEELYACVILKQGSAMNEADLLEWFAGRFKDSKVDDNRAPKYVEIFDDFPRLQNGKVLKKELKAIVEACFP